MRCCARRMGCGLLTVVMGAVGASAVAAEDCPAGTQTIPIVLTAGMLSVGGEKIPNDVVEVLAGFPLLWSVTNNSGREVKASFVNFHKEGDPQKKEDAIKFPGRFRSKKHVDLDKLETETLCVTVKKKSTPYTYKVKYDIKLEFEDDEGEDKDILHDPRLDIKEPGPFGKPKGKGGIS